MSRSKIGWANLLTIVAAVDTVAERHPILPSDDSRRLGDPSQAATGVDDARSHDRPGGTSFDAAMTRSATVGRRFGDRFDLGVGDHGTKHKPGAPAGEQQV